ncbi:LADA_0D10286g1_1 [Lachancea dasiensis]|uniref:LADA_0D10286g1_1 n=1 Tax=Lachancea dasiensis TaxID=1072105 RepID=A0A1G4J7K2_9SACH|nr:LADA_0D10286g1_1 [Lachancea dasiensis]
MPEPLSAELNYIEELLKGLERSSDDKKTLLSLHKSFSGDADDLYAKYLSESADRWEIIFAASRALNEDREIGLITAFFLDKGSTIMVRKYGNSAIHKSFCNLVQDHFVISTVANQLLWHQYDETLEAQIVKSLLAFIRCLKLLDTQDQKVSSKIFCDSVLRLKAPGFFTVLTSILENAHRYDEDLVWSTERCVVDLATISMSLRFCDMENLEGTLTSTMLELLDRHFKVKEYEIGIKDTFDGAEESRSGLSITNALDIIVFLRDANVSFRKKYLERLLFEEHAFPIVQGLSWLSDQLSITFSQYFSQEKVDRFIMQCFLNKDVLIFSLVDKLMDLWIESRAQSFDDFNSILETFKVAFFLQDSFLGSQESEIGNCLANVRLLSYEKLRDLQLRQIRTAHHKKWERQISTFDSMLSNQVLEYVRHQRLLQLQKGAWVYSDNPLDRNVKQPKVYYVVLSDNQMNLLAKEYRAKCEESPAVVGNDIVSTDGSKGKTTVIPVRRVHKFQHWKVQADSKVPVNAKLINILNKAVYTEIHLLDKDESVMLTFFLDSREASYIWLDGLQLIVAAAQGKEPSLSDDLKSQISNLIDLRKNVQIVGLDKTILNEHDSDLKAEEQYYDLEVLQALTTDFHYD